MRGDWIHLRSWQWRGRPLTWRERLALAVFAFVTIPVVLLVLAGLFLFAVGLATVALAGWLVAAFVRPSRRGANRPDLVIETEYRRISEERGPSAARNPWEGR